MRGPLREKGRTLDVLAAIGFAVLALFSWKVGFIDSDGDNSADPWLFTGGFFVAGIATLLIIAAVTHRGSMTSSVLSTPVLMWIGTRSYGLYLYHWPIYQIVRNTAGTKLKFHEFVLCMVATAIITEISYRYIETPIRKGHLSAWWRSRGQRSPQAENRGVLLGAGVLGTALVIFAGASLATAELKQNEVAQRLDEAAESTCSVIEGNCDEASGGVLIVEETEAIDAEDPDAEADPAVEGESGPETTAAPESPSQIAIGDSVMLGAAEQMQAAGFAVDAEESRSFRRGIEIVEALAEQNQLPEELVIHLGTNGPIGQSEMDEMMALVVDVPRVLLVENDVPRDYEAANNTLIANAASSRTNVGVLYWNGLASSCPGDCIYQDGFHLKTSGAEYYTSLVVSAFEDPDVFG